MHNRITCGISSRTLHSYDKEKLTVVFNAISTGEEIGKVVSPIPFIINMKFEDGIKPLTKKDNKEFRRLAYFLLANKEVSIRNIETKEITNFHFKRSEFPTTESIDLLTLALSEFPNDTFEVSFSSYNMNFSVIPFITDKNAFDIIKNNDFNINHWIKRKEDLYKWCCKETRQLKKMMEETEKPEQETYLDFIIKATHRNKFKGIRKDLFKESIFFQPSIFRTIGIYGRGKKTMESFHKMIDVYWTIFKLMNMNINLAQHSSVYPNSISGFHEDNIKFHEEILKVLKSKS